MDSEKFVELVKKTIVDYVNESLDITDGKKNIASIGETSKEAIYAIYGKEAVAETIEVKAEREGVSVSGFVGKPTFSKSNRTYQTLIVNGRYVVNMTVQTAVTNAYGDFLMKRQYPFFVLYFQAPDKNTP